MVNERTVETSRLTTFVLEEGEGEPVVFVHGNLSDAEVWREQLGLLPDGYRGVALDLRGYGRSEHKPVDATRGVDDYAEDLRGLIEALDLGAVHLVAHSLGGVVAYRYTMNHPDLVRSLTLVAPVSPYGFGGTKADGTPCWDDFAGSGGGAANAEFVHQLDAGDRSADKDSSPRNIIRTIFFPEPDDIREEDAILESMLRGAVGEDHYPGDTETCDHWPGITPGTRGVLNAISPKYLDLSGFADCGASAPVLWVHGDDDAVISDTSLTDLGHLGAIGAVPGWPGEDAHPAQPMEHQTRQVLSRYAAASGSYREEVLAGTGHFVFTQMPQEFAELLHTHLRDASA